MQPLLHLDFCGTVEVPFYELCGTVGVPSDVSGITFSDASGVGFLPPKRFWTQSAVHGGSMIVRRQQCLGRNRVGMTVTSGDVVPFTSREVMWLWTLASLGVMPP